MRYLLQRYLHVAAVTTILLAPAAVHAQQADIRGEGLSQTVDCLGGDATVEGNGNRLVFHGDCTRFDLRGNGNSVRIDLAGRATIHLEGNGNRVRYYLHGGSEPRITVRGEGDQVNAGE